jgi:hypothetical protein
MTKHQVMKQKSVRMLGVEDGAVRKHTQQDSSQDVVGIPTPVEKVARG